MLAKVSEIYERDVTFYHFLYLNISIFMRKIIRFQIESMDGTVALKTAPLKGTTFTFRIPRASAANFQKSLQKFDLCNGIAIAQVAKIHLS